MRNKRLAKLIVPILVLGGLLLISQFFGIQNKKVNFNTDIKPILNKHCISCHGGVKQSGGLSLMTREDALLPTDSEKPAIIPGHPDRSEFIQRLLSEDPESRMPYEADPLPKSDIQLLRRWIKQGAPWGLHWAYQPVVEVEVPKSKQALGAIKSSNQEPWAQNDIDHFILDGLEKLALQPSPQADKATLLRRASLDLIGLPPPEKLAKQFLADDSPDAYEKLIDELLKSPQFGEHWATTWLDIARYADSKGFERDPHRSIWPYRDWVIDAFNRDLPYDQFLTEQLAGDLLPDPTDAQYLATGFHRNTSTNDEGGADNEEYRVAAVVDRVNTTWEGIMGTTFACTQCHGHPYDPFRHEDYYKFMAYFNNTRDEDTAADYPWLRIFSSEDSLKLKSLDNWLQENSDEERTKEIIRFIKTWQPSINGIAGDQFVNSELYDTKTLTFRNHGSCRFKGIHLGGKSHLIFRYQASQNQGSWSIRLDSLNGPVLGTTVFSKTKGGWQYGTLDFSAIEGKHDLYFTYENPHIKDDKTTGLKFDWFAFTKPFPGEGKDGFGANLQLFWDLMNARTKHSLIMIENPEVQSRTTQVFDRGNWMVKTTEVQADVPAIFPPFPKGAPPNRLGLAQWLTDPQHPLTSRTMVNRLWEKLFGMGIVETLEDLGTQGQPPSHPELLNWISWRFMHEHQWSVKSLLKEIMMSATYQQDSKASTEVLKKDPYNRYYARAPRPRLSAEQLRDQALSISGLLSSKMGGPGVMPYQPEGIWRTPYNNQKWKMSKEEDLHRRSVYTYWKRSAPYPAFLTFDAAPRQVCAARRINTNTPLQVLVTLNDPVYMEAAQYFALRTQKNAENKKADEWIAKAYQLATNRPIPENKLAALKNLYQQALEDFEKEPKKAEALLDKIEKNDPETAALTIVTNAILNLDELITRP